MDLAVLSATSLHARYKCGARSSLADKPYAIFVYNHLVNKDPPPSFTWTSSYHNPSLILSSASMSGRRVAIIGGGAFIAGGTYYLYSAGGDPKVAQKKIERKSSMINPLYALINISCHR